MKSIKNRGKSRRFGVNIGNIFGIPLFGGIKSQVLNEVLGILGSNDNKMRLMITLNAEHVLAALKDDKYMELLEKSYMNVIDGISLVWAEELDRRFKNLDSSNWNRVKKIVVRWGLGWKVGVKVLKGELVDRVVAGSSLMDDLVKLAEEKGKSVYFLGGWGDRAKRTKKYFEVRYEKLKAGSCPGEPVLGNIEVLEKISSFRPDILFVAYGMKKQEMWIAKNKAELEKAGVRLAVGVGRSFDYYSGDLKRAPESWRRKGLEWLYSLLKEPKRLGRQLGIPKFLWRVVWAGV